MHIFPHMHCYSLTHTEFHLPFFHLIVRLSCLSRQPVVVSWLKQYENIVSEAGNKGQSCRPVVMWEKLVIVYSDLHSRTNDKVHTFIHIRSLYVSLWPDWYKIQFDIKHTFFYSNYTLQWSIHNELTKPGWRWRIYFLLRQRFFIS